MNHDEVNVDIWEDKIKNGWTLLNKMSYVQLFLKLDIVKLWKK